MKDTRREEFKAFVAWVGGPRDAAKALGIARSTVDAYRYGQRRIPPAIAERAEIISKGRYSKERMIWLVAS